MGDGYAESKSYLTFGLIGLVLRSGPSAPMSMKTGSAVALKQLNVQTVMVRTRTAAQMQHYLREFVYASLHMEPTCIAGGSQRAHGWGKVFLDCQKCFN